MFIHLSLRIFDKGKYINVVGSVVHCLLSEKINNFSISRQLRMECIACIFFLLYVDFYMPAYTTYLLQE